MGPNSPSSHLSDDLLAPGGRLLEASDFGRSSSHRSESTDDEAVSRKFGFSRDIS